MPDAAKNLDQEFWRPPIQSAAAVRPHTELCPRCNTEFLLGSRFCHICGASRETQPAGSDRFTRWLDLSAIAEATGLTAASLIAFIVGVVCLIGAVAVGLIYTATTVLDWQAVQLWRIQWLLAALAVFTAGILLNRAAR
jgi:hypothetical protein